MFYELYNFGQALSQNEPKKKVPMTILTSLTFFLAFSYLFFGWACFATSQMRSEFKRYGLSAYRKVLGTLQLLGSSGLILGFFYWPLLQTVAAAGLTLLMILGFIVRLKIRDTFVQSAPSLLYALLNAYLCYRLITLL